MGGRLYGRAGSDSITGAPGRDVIEPGAGRDSVWLTGKSGRGDGDLVRTRDGELDEIHCDPLDRSDRVLLDGLDWADWKKSVALAGPPDGRLRRCHGIARSARPRRAFPLDADYDYDDYYSPAGPLLVSIACPFGGPPVCDGTLAIYEGRRLLARETFRVRAGRARVVPLEGHCRCRHDPDAFIAHVAVKTRSANGLLAAVVRRFEVVVDPTDDN